MEGEEGGIVDSLILLKYFLLIKICSNWAKDNLHNQEETIIAEKLTVNDSNENLHGKVHNSTKIDNSCL